MSYWAPHESKLEVDLILTQGKDLIAIELKSGQRLRPEDFAGINAISDLRGIKRRIIIYQGRELMKKDGVEIIPIADFLEKQILRTL